MAKLNKVRAQLLDANTGAVIEDVDVLTSADAVKFDDGKNLSEVTAGLAQQLAQKAEKGELSTKVEKSYVDTNLATLDTKITAQASGSPKGTYSTLSDLKIAFPTGNSNIYLVTADGNWYYWNNVDWVSGGVYQAAGIADKAVTAEKTAFLNIDKRNVFNPNTAKDGYRLGVNGELIDGSTFTTSDFFPVKSGEKIIIVMGTGTSAVSGRVVQYDANRNFISVLSTGVTTGQTITATQDGLIRIPVPISSKNNTLIANINDYTGEFVPFGYLTDRNIKAAAVDNGIISASNLTSNFRYRNTLTAPDLNSVLSDGTYLLISGGTNRPPEVTDSNAYLVVTNIGNTIIQDYTEYTALKQRKVFRRYIRINVNEFGQWFLMNRDEEQGANYLENKTVVIMGDSITGASGYRGQLARRLRANVINCGFGGTRMTYHTDPNFDKFSFTKLVDAKITNDFTEQDIAASNLQVTNMPQNLANFKSVDFSKVDYLTIWFGTNDFSGDIYIGENGSEDRTTVKGALQYGIRRLLETYPQLKIIIITPMFRLVGAGTSDDTTNSYRLLYLNDYVKAIEEVATVNHLPCLNMYKESGINKFNHTHYLSDGLHPYLEKGYVHVGNKIASFIAANF